MSLVLFLLVQASALSPLSLTANQDLVSRSLKAAGFTKIGTAALMGNIDVETGGTFSYSQKQQGGNGYGLFQFDFLKRSYQQWLIATGKHDGADAQCQFVAATITGNKRDLIGAGNAKKIAKALSGQSLDTATEIFCNMWEKPGVPHLDQRKESARKFYGLLKFF